MGWNLVVICVVLITSSRICNGSVERKLFEDKCRTCEDKIEKLESKLYSLERLVVTQGEQLKLIQQEISIEHWMTAPVTGLPGPKGESGDVGPPGLQGNLGPQGPGGQEGPKGEVGLKGESGINGIPGTNGMHGLLGPKGDPGPQGQEGPKGKRGQKGEIGIPGTNGMHGLPGQKGDPGINANETAIMSLIDKLKLTSQKLESRLNQTGKVIEDIETTEHKDLDAKLDSLQLNKTLLNIQSCMDFWKSKNITDTVRSEVITSRQLTIYSLGSSQPKQVQCDFEKDGGGWTVIQQRNSGPIDQFDLGWAAYEEGFGNPPGNYWIGLKTMHALTNKTRQELRVDLEDWDGNVAYAKYNSFYVGSASELYALRVGNYSGTAGDSLSYRSGRRFRILDGDDNKHCIMNNSGGWWYVDCADCSLNGYYYTKNDSGSFCKVYWYRFQTGSLKRVSMKIRPV